MTDRREEKRKYHQEHREEEREYRKKNKEKIKEQKRQYEITHAEQLRKYRSEHRSPKNKNYAPNRARILENNRLARLKVINAYGGKCVCCGESEPCFLAIDHIDNNGAYMRKNKLHPKNGRELYYWIIKNNYPDIFQILCHNCNSAKAYYRICPHQTTKNDAGILYECIQPQKQREDPHEKEYLA
jgi:hypothetical protein